MSKTVKFAGLAVLWAALAVAGYWLARDGGTTLSEQLRDKPTVNAHEIEVALADLDGAARTLSDWREGPMVVNFWATWCAPCRREIPLLIDLQNEHRDTGLTVVGVAIDETEPVQAYAADMGINYPVLVGEAQGVEMATALGADTLAVPLTVFVDRAGAVTRLHLGELHAKDAETAVAELLAR